NRRIQTSHWRFHRWDHLRWKGSGWLSEQVFSRIKRQPMTPMKSISPVLKKYTPPALAIALFLMAWSFGAKQIETSLGQVPGPAMVLDQGRILWQEHVAERQKAREFYERQKDRRAAMLEVNPSATVAA